MKKHLSILTLMAVLLIGTTVLSCSQIQSDTARQKVVERVSVEEFKELAREAYEEGSDVSLSYDSLNNRVLLRTYNNDQNSHDTLWDEIGDNIVPLVAVALGVIIPGAVTVMVFFLIFRYLRQRRLDRYHVIEHSIDKGVVLPDSFYMAESNKNTNTPRSAIVWIGWGIALIVFFLGISAEELTALGIIPLFIGIARGVTYLINRHDNKVKEQRKREETATPLFPDFTDEE